MTELSPAAQVVIDAWWNASDGEYINGVWTPNRSAQLAAALDAVADQVVPKDDYYENCDVVREELLAIAAELRGDTLHDVRRSATRALAGDKEAARQFLHEAGFTDKEGNLRPPYCSEEP